MHHKNKELSSQRVPPFCCTRNPLPKNGSESEAGNRLKASIGPGRGEWGGGGGVGACWVHGTLGLFGWGCATGTLSLYQS